jgi:hypothetical protein
MTALILLALLSLATPTMTAHSAGCSWCDTTAPDYNSSSWQRRFDSGQNFPGNGRGTSGDYWTKERNIQRDNRQMQEREQARQEQRRGDSYGQRHRDSGGDSGGGQCRGLYGC